MRYNSFVPEDSLAKDLRILKACGKLDSIDTGVPGGEFLRTIASAYAYKKRELSSSAGLKRIQKV